MSQAKHIFFSFSFSILAAIYSCSDYNSEDQRDFQVLSDSVRSLNRELSIKNDMLYETMENKLNAGIETLPNSSIQIIKLRELRAQTREINSRIIKYSIALTRGTEKDSSVLTTDWLYSKNKLYKNLLQQIDPEITNILGSQPEILTHYFDSLSNKNPKEFPNYLSDAPKDEKFYILNQTLCNIHSLEQKVLLFCSTKVNR